jgi:hypothetical protein
VDNIFVTKRSLSVYLRANDADYIGIVDFEKAFDPLDMQTSSGVKSEK